MTTLKNCIEQARNYVNDNREALAEQRRAVDEIYEKYDLHVGGNDEAISMALDPDNEAFATTTLYWDCECERDYIRSAEMDVCLKCGHYAEDQPDSRINEVIAVGLPLNLDNPATRLSVEFHSIGRI